MTNEEHIAQLDQKIKILDRQIADATDSPELPFLEGWRAELQTQREDLTVQATNTQLSRARRKAWGRP